MQIKYIGKLNQVKNLFNYIYKLKLIVSNDFQSVGFNSLTNLNKQESKYSQFFLSFILSMLMQWSLFTLCVLQNNVIELYNTRTHFLFQFVVQQSE